MKFFVCMELFKQLLPQRSTPSNVTRGQIPPSVKRILYFYRMVGNDLSDDCGNHRRQTGVHEIDRLTHIKYQFRLNHPNDEKADMITDLSFTNINNMEGDSLMFTKEIKHCIETNNTMLVFIKSSASKEEKRNQVAEILNQVIILPSI